MRKVVVARKCDPKDPQVVCTNRFLAEGNGEFWWDHARGGWCHKDIVRTQCPDGYRRAYMGLPDSTGVPYLLERCFSCGVALPDLYSEGLTPFRNQGDGEEG
jgi:hypothetical protein